MRKGRGGVVYISLPLKTLVQRAGQKKSKGHEARAGKLPFLGGDKLGDGFSRGS